MLKIQRKIIQLFKAPVSFENCSTDPISRDFGFSRGKPIDRYYIESFLKENSDCVKGSVMEISENAYSKQFDTGVTSFEILHVDNSNKRATIIGDLTDESTLPDERIDCFICTQTLNFIFDVDKAIAGIRKILKQKGVFLGTVSGISQISRYDMDRWGDYWRFTDLSVRKLFEKQFKPEDIEIKTFGNVFAAKAFLSGLSVEDIPDHSLLDKQDNDYQIIVGIKATKN